MEEDVLIIPAKRKDLSIINKRSIAIGISVGAAIALTVGAVLLYKNNIKSQE